MLYEMSEGLSTGVERRGEGEEPVRTEGGKESVSATDNGQAGMEITNGKMEEEGE